MSFFPLALRFTTILSEIKVSGRESEYTRLLRAFHFFKIVCRLSFFSFSYPFAAVIDLLRGLLPAGKRPRKHHRDVNFYHEVANVVAGNFAARFSIKSLSIFAHISGSIERSL